jgi:hypothetical protein
MESSSPRSVTIRFRSRPGDLREAETGLARALGFDGAVSPTPGGWIIAALISLIPSSATIDDTGVRIGGVTRLWEDIGLSYETENLVCLVLTRTSGPITLPKSAMSDADLVTVRSLAADRVVTTPDILEHLTRIRTGQEPGG